MSDYKYYDRELSWLWFNGRVLQEAADPRVPLFERIKFLAIYSSNLDEFFRVRVASLRSLQSLGEKSKKKLEFSPSELLKKIHEEIKEQQETFGLIYRKEIIPLLEENNIFIIDHNSLNPEQEEYAREYFRENVIQHVRPVLLVKGKIMPFLQNQMLYLAVRLTGKGQAEGKRRRFNYAIVEVPSHHAPRFVTLPESGGKTYIMFLDDIVRLNLDQVFPGFGIQDSYSVKLTRDAELYIDDEFTGNLLQKIKKGLKKRDTGAPSRFLYDAEIPPAFLNFLKEALCLSQNDLVPGGRYHNFYDFFGFPEVEKKDLYYGPLEPIKYGNGREIFDLLKEKDRALFYPYYSYDFVLDALDKAAEDPGVVSIKITQYRVAKNSRVIEKIKKAARNGKDVMAFVELKARFDEEINIESARGMEEAGVKVYYSFPGLKVHAKICSITRKEGDDYKTYCYLATGNFNEKTAKVYSDFGLFTSDERITSEVEKVFLALAGNSADFKFEHLLVGRFNMRKGFSKLIGRETKNALEGKEAWMILKMNSLEDKKMIDKLYEASRAGVKIKLIVRGICCLVPGVEGQSENIELVSIVDRFLEHSRFYLFANGGEPLFYSASADFMKRNLSRRIEVAFPIYDDNIKRDILSILDLQLNDNSKARILDPGKINEYVQPEKENKGIRSQIDAYYYFLKKKNFYYEAKDEKNTYYSGGAASYNKSGLPGSKTSE